jgi:hypothetical protein
VSDSSALRGPIARARAIAIVGLASGLGVAALAGVYIGFVSGVLEDARGYPMTGFIYLAAIGVVPLVVGLPIALLSVLRLRLLARADAHPEEVEAAELAMRFGRPALKLWFRDRKSVVVATGDADRNQLIGSIKLPRARVVR